METVSPAAAPAISAGRLIQVTRLNDELLARHAARGGERAFAALYERYHQALYRYCRSILRDDADAQDALQSTFAGALSALRRGQRNAPLRPWLFRIAHNESISVLRRRHRDGERELSEGDLRVVSSAEDQAAERARWATLVADLGELPDRLRGALLMRELSGLSHEEVATALGTTAAGAKQAIFEARQALAELAEGRAMSCEDVCRRISEGDRRVLRGRRVRAHLRGCGRCEAFAAAIPARRSDLRALAPVLPPVAAGALLTRSIHAASAHGGAGAASSAATSAATVGVVGKAAGSAIAWKALTGVAVLATAAAGAAGLEHVLRHHHPSVAGRAAHVRPAGAVGPGRRVGRQRTAGSAVPAGVQDQRGAALHGVGARSHGGRGQGAAAAIVTSAGNAAAAGVVAGLGASHGSAAGSHGRGHSASRGTAKGKPTTSKGRAVAKGRATGSRTRSHDSGAKGQARRHAKRTTVTVTSPTDMPAKSRRGQSTIPTT